jgi:chromosome partitioning protein
MPFVVSLVQFKGGCGKTTLGVTLYATSVSRFDSSGIIDLDPQGNASAWCLGRKGFQSIPQHEGAEALCVRNDTVTAPRFRVNQTPEGALAAAVECRRIDGGKVFPSNVYISPQNLSAIELGNVPLGVVVVDTPPHMPSTLLRSIVAQSDAVVVPVQPEAFCVQNITQLLSEIDAAGGGDLIESGRVRFVFNMVQKCVTHAAWSEMVRTNWGELLSAVSIPRAMAWADASNHGKKWNPKSKPAATANELWDDILTMAQRRAAA